MLHYILTNERFTVMLISKSGSSCCQSVFVKFEADSQCEIVGCDTNEIIKNMPPGYFVGK